MPRDVLRIHVVMDPGARRHLVEEGRLAGDPSRIADAHFAPGYGWMRDRMLERIGPPDRGEPWPLWGWRRRMGRSKPMARSYRLDEDHWIVSFDIPAGRVVLSDFGEWHNVLNHWYLPDRKAPDGGLEADAELAAAMEAAGVDFLSRPYPEPWQSTIERSWAAVFDVEGSRDVQATFWSVDRSMIVSESRIPARPR